jgi:competence protein ComEC
LANAPPVARLALAFALGVSSGIFGAPVWTAPLGTLIWFFAPNPTSLRPRRALWIFVGLLGALAGWDATSREACLSPAPGTRVELKGRLLASPRGGSASFQPQGRCAPITVVTQDSTLPAGVPMTLRGTWMAGRRRPWLRAAESSIEPLAGGATETRWAAVRWRQGLVERLERLYGHRAPLVAALTLARREGLDRELGETFARTGIAHLLAISGFHVGVIGGAALAILRLARVPRRRAAVGSAVVSWAYVGLIGFPDAACRAALILVLVAASRARGRPPARWGPLATAFLILLVVDPDNLASPGFQLSFAGAAGLVAWARPVADTLRRRLRCPRPLAVAVGAGVAATLATLPVVGWHFERVSLVGVPMTLGASPLVSLALPGAIASLLMDALWAPGGDFLAGGVDTLLAVLESGARRVAGQSWASAWTSRSSVAAGLLGCVIGSYISRHPRVRSHGRRAILATYTAVALVAWPLVFGIRGWGTLELLVIDVGQGDAIALRSPRGRWLLVDAGPPARTSASGRLDPGAHPVVRTLRARGVSRLEALVLTHPDLDHIGGATAVLGSFDVGAVYDPAIAAGKAEYVDVLTMAAEAGVPWVAARAGQSIDFDGVTVDVLHPVDPSGAGAESNEASVVLHVRLGDFDALLTGDAYKETERRIAPLLGDFELLKVGHHGSDTSTDSLLLAAIRPELAIVSVGRFNRYGHPDPAVLGRLVRAGVTVHRTDRAGTITVVARRDGSSTVSTAIPEPRDSRSWRR